jgi:GDP-L-fucose synthase
MQNVDFSKLRNKKIAITGSKGFIAKNILEVLESANINKKNITEINSSNCDYFNLDKLYKKLKNIDYVIHLSSATGGIKFTKEKLTYQYYTSLIKDLNVFEASAKAGVKKLITLGNLHAYPEDVKVPISENQLHNGLPAKTHLGIGWVKRNLSILSEIYSRQVKSKFIILYSANTYGPYDSTDLNYGHIIPALIIKCLKNKNFKLFGSLNAIREFIYAQDIAKIILLSLIKIDKSCYFNVGSSEKILMSDLLNMIIKKTEFSKKITYKNTFNDKTKRYSDNLISKNIFKNYSYTFLDEGLEKTIDWYRSNINRSNIK